MDTDSLEASGPRNSLSRTCPDCSTPMEDLGDRFECPNCKFTLMKDYSSF